MKRYLFIYLSSLILLSLPVKRTWNHKKPKSFNFIEKSLSFLPKKEKAVTRGLFFGDKRYIRKKVKEKFKILGIYHLLTPSGLHLSSLLALFIFCFKKLKKNKSFQYLKSGILLMPFMLDGFYSLKRMALFYIISGLLLRDKIWESFLLTMLVDFIFGSFQVSPLSFTYSYLFFGSIISLLHHPKRVFIALYIGQMTIHFFQFQKFNLLGPIFGLGLTAFFSTLFPILVGAFIVSSRIYLFLLNIFLELVDLCYKISSISLEIIPGFFLISCVFFLFITRNKVFLYATIILYTTPLPNIPFKDLRKRPRYKDYKLLKTTPILFNQYTKRGFKSYHPHQIVCHIKIYNHFYKRRCKTHNKTIPQVK